MKSNELRIGNLLIYKGVEWKVDQIPDDDNYFDGFEPIPLTEDWLLKFGFQKHQWKNELWYTIENLAIEKTDGGFYDRETGTKIDSIHWLQNYTFFKTGTELSPN